MYHVLNVEQVEYLGCYSTCSAFISICTLGTFDTVDLMF